MWCFCRSSSSSSTAGAPTDNRTESRRRSSRQPRRQPQTGTRTSSDRLKTGPTTSYHGQGSRVTNPPYNRTPSIEIVVDSDPEESRFCPPRRNLHQDQGKKMRMRNNHPDRSVLQQGQSTRQPLGQCRYQGDERLAQKYSELRRLLLDRLDLRTLTPQVPQLTPCWKIGK